jgi:regulator of sigma E protease
MEWLPIAGWIVGSVVVILGPIMLFHELGHFSAAKLAGVRVDEFGFGYPPRIVRLWRGRGHLVVDGVHVDIPGRAKVPPWLDDGSWAEVVVRERPGRNAILRAIVALDDSEGGMSVQRERRGNDIHIRGQLSDFEPGTVYSLNLLPMGAFVRMKGEEDPTHPKSLAAQPKRWRIGVLAAGAALNFVLAFVLLVSAYAFSGVPSGWLVEIDSVEPGTAAESAGLMAGDVILSVDGERLVDGDTEFRSIIQGSPGDPVSLGVLRNGEEISLVAAPDIDPEGDGYLGVYMARRPDPDSVERMSGSEAVSESGRDVWELVTFPLRLREMLASGEVTAQEVRPSSVVGIGGVLTLFLQQSLTWRWAFPILHTAGLVSLSLGIANLLPLPALDGGRIMFVLLEAIRGRRVPPEREAMVHVIGLLLLVGLMALVMVQDVVNPVIPWSWLQR